MNSRLPANGQVATELLEDWITIWQSELAALVVDREAQDTLLRLVNGWAAQSMAAVALLAQAPPAAPAPHPKAGDNDPPGPAGAHAPTRPQAVDAPPPGKIAAPGNLARPREPERQLARRNPDDPA